MSIFEIHEPITLLGTAVSLNEAKIVILLLEGGADPNVTPVSTGSSDCTLLHLLCGHPWKEAAAVMIHSLCQNGAQVSLELMVLAFSTFSRWVRQVSRQDDSSHTAHFKFGVLESMNLNFLKFGHRVRAGHVLAVLYSQQEYAPPEPLKEWLKESADLLGMEKDVIGAFSSSLMTSGISHMISYLRVILDIGANPFEVTGAMLDSKDLHHRDMETLEREVRRYVEKSGDSPLDYDKWFEDEKRWLEEDEKQWLEDDRERMLREELGNEEQRRIKDEMERWLEQNECYE